MRALPGNVLAGDASQRLGRFAGRWLIFGPTQDQCAPGYGLGNLLRRQTLLLHGCGQNRRCTVLQQLVFLQMADHAVGQWNRVFINAVNPKQTQRGTLDGGGGEPGHLIKYLARNAPCRIAGAVDLGLSQLQMGHVIASFCFQPSSLSLRPPP
ncbi:hypothetical protein GALL_452250 [mine drainage metagenome]|uniref:Uncharacterized protein n=1 Tax=mine drainage metagenome TaxID=410659 RepID=A0A1J5PPQ6_9ZZZZ